MGHVVRKYTELAGNSFYAVADAVTVRMGKSVTLVKLQVAAVMNVAELAKGSTVLRGYPELGETLFVFMLVPFYCFYVYPALNIRPGIA